MATPETFEPLPARLRQRRMISSGSAALAEVWARALLCGWRAGEVHLLRLIKCLAGTFGAIHAALDAGQLRRGRHCWISGHAWALRTFRAEEHNGTKTSTASRSCGLDGHRDRTAAPRPAPPNMKLALDPDASSVQRVLGPFSI